MRYIQNVPRVCALAPRVRSLAWSGCVALAACGGTADVPMVEVIPVYANVDGVTRDAGAALAAGESLTAGGTSVAALTLDFDRDTARVSDGAILLRRNAAGELAITIEGETESFAATDRQISADDGRVEGYVTRDDARGVFVGLFGHSGPITELLQPGSSYAEGISLFTSEVGRETEQRFLYAVVGTQTRPEVFAQHSLGTYEGLFKIEALPTDYQSFSEQRSRFRGDATLSVTLDGTISGELSNVRVLEPDATEFAPIAGTVEMTAATITAEGFSGDLIADPTFASQVLAPNQSRIGTYGGTFYGPAAQEAAGAISVTAAGQDNDIVGAGFFTTAQQGNP
ncbi:hypothetical protein [Yoonia sp. 208BN28-4]|uniref:hypothetical protein n=1 Tax=Yoonia sp. 208BN28-4 TaxID=3126505 RepID=UPI0030ABD8EA